MEKEAAGNDWRSFSVFPLPSPLFPQTMHVSDPQTGGRIKGSLPSDPCSSALICTPVSLLQTGKTRCKTRGIFNKNIKPALNGSDYQDVEAPEGAAEVLWEWKVQMTPGASRCQHIHVQLIRTPLKCKQSETGDRLSTKALKKLLESENNRFRAIKHPDKQRKINRNPWMEQDDEHTRV